MHGSGVERTAGMCRTANCVERGCVVYVSPDSLVANIEVDDTVITRTTREQGFKALGVWITLMATSCKNWRNVR